MAGASVPLVALRADLDGGWPPGARWLTTGGVEGVVLEQPVGARVAFGLGPCERGLRFRAGVRVEGAGGFKPPQVRVLAVGADGGETSIWKSRSRLAGLGRSGLRIEAEIPASTERLVLVASEPEAGTVRWERPEILVGSGHQAEPPPPPTPPAPSPDGEADAQTHGGPRFTVLTPVHDPPLEILEETLDSVRAQTFEDWELCLVDDGSKDPAVRETLARYAAADPRIRLLRREVAGGISAATNAGLEMAAGEFVALLDHDDLLVPEALAEVEAELRRRPQTDMLYSDEELFSEDGPGFTFAKPHWSPDLLRSQMYTCHLGVYRRSLAEDVGGFRTDFDGSQDLDFALRIAERSDRIIHVPRVLYRWRAHAASTAGGGQAKPAAYPAARRAIAEHLARKGVEGEVHFGPWQGIYRVVHRPPAGLVVRVAVVAHDPESAAVRRLVEAVEDEGASGVAGARAVVAPTQAAACELCADADAIVLCESAAVEPLTRLWLARLAAFSLQPGVAAVGAKALAPDGRVEHGGLAVEAGLPLPIMYGTPADDPGPLGIGVVPANVTAVDGIVAFGGEAFRELGGLAEDRGALAVPDYCLRAQQAGLRVALAPDVLLRRTDEAGVGDDPCALHDFRRRWAAEFPRDRYFDLDVVWPGIAVAPASG